MDRGRYHSPVGRNENSRLGPQSFDRGWGRAQLNRPCFHCGQDGHVKRFCPELSSLWESERAMERPTGRANGRLSSNPLSSRSDFSQNYEHGHSRNDNLREPSGNRHPHFDYRENDDSNYRSRDTRDRLRARSSAVSHFDYHDSFDSSQRPRGTGHSHRDHEAGGNTRRDHDAGGHFEFPALSADVKVADVNLNRIISGKPVNDSRQVSESCREDNLGKGDNTGVELAGNGDVSRRHSGEYSPPGEDKAQNEELGIPSSQNDTEELLTKRSSRPSKKRGEPVLECIASQTAESSVLSPNGKLPLSIVCMDAVDKVIGCPSDNFDSVTSIDFQKEGVGLLRHTVPSSAETQKERSSGICETGLISGEENSTADDFLPLSSAKGCVIENQRDDVFLPLLSESPALRDHSKAESPSAKEGGGDGRVVGEPSGQQNVETSTEFRGQSGNGRRVSRWSARKEDQARDSTEEAHVLEQARDPVSEAAQKLALVLPGGTNVSEQDCEMKLSEVDFDGKVYSESQDKQIVERNGNSKNGIADLAKSGRFVDRGNAQHGHQRDSKVDRHFGIDTDFFGVESGPDYGSDADRMKRRDRSSCMSTPRGLSDGKDTENSQEFYKGGASDGVVVRRSARNGFSNDGGSSKKFNRRGDTADNFHSGGMNRLGNPSDLPLGGEAREGRGSGSLGYRHSKSSDVYPGHLRRHPSSYVSVCNARFLDQGIQRHSTSTAPSWQAPFPVDPFYTSSHRQDVNFNVIDLERKGVMICDVQGIMQGPVPLVQLKELMDSGKLSVDCKIQFEESNDWLNMDRAETILNSKFGQRLVGSGQLPGTKSSPASEIFSQASPPIVQSHHRKDIIIMDISAKEVDESTGGYNEEVHDDFHIDERVQKLMDGINLIPGMEKEIVHDALRKASHRVQLEYESHLGSEMSPCAHGGIADLSAEWKCGDMGNDFLGLNVFDDLTSKRNGKVDEAGMVVVSEEVLKDINVPEPAVFVNCNERSKQVSKWPSRGGDWKVIYFLDNSQKSRGVQALPEKGCPTHPRKVVMNAGLPLCGSKNMSRLDPRKHGHEVGKSISAELNTLLVPKFAQKSLASKLEGCVEGNHNPLSLVESKAADVCSLRPQAVLQGHLAMQGKDSLVPDGLKLSKSDKNITSQGLVTGPWSKSGNRNQQCQVSTKVHKGSNSARKSPAAIANIAATTDKHGHALFVANRVEIESNPASYRSTSHDIGSVSSIRLESSGARAELCEGSSMDRKTDDARIASMWPQCGQAQDMAAFHFNHPQFLAFTRSKLHEYVIKSYKAVFSAVLNDGLDKWLQKNDEKLSALTPAAPVLVSPSLPSSTVSALEGNSPGILKLFQNGKLEVEGECRGKSPSNEKLFLDHAVGETAFFLDSGFKTVEGEGWKTSSSSLLDVTEVDGDVSRHKRKALPEEDELYKHPHKKHQRKSHLGNEEHDRKLEPSFSSLASQVVGSAVPYPIEDIPVHFSEYDSLKRKEVFQSSCEEQSWAALKPRLLRSIFRFLRGDVRTIVNAMATCKSWMEVGKRWKPELTLADLSSVHHHSLNAALESLSGFGGRKLQRIILKGCSVAPESLEYLLRACPSISVIEMGCNDSMQELTYMFPKVQFLRVHNVSPRDCLPGRPEVFKTRTMRGTAQRRDSSQDYMSNGDDDSENYPGRDSASTSRCPGYSCLTNMDVDTLVHTSKISDSTHGAHDATKHIKGNESLIKESGPDAFTIKTNKHEIGTSVPRVSAKQKAMGVFSRKKSERDASGMPRHIVNGQRVSEEKHGSSFANKVHCVKSIVVEGKSFEKEIAKVLRVLMNADTKKCFQSANVIAADAKSAGSTTGKFVDLLIIEKKLKGGAYAAGKDGFKAFKEDVNLLIRIAFRQRKDKSTYLTAEKIFKVALRLFASLDSQISGIELSDSHNHGKVSGARRVKKVGTERLKNLSMLQHSGNKSKSDENGGHKSKVGIAKKSGQGETDIGDLDSDSVEHENRRILKPKDEQRWEFEGESSEEDEESGFLEDEDSVFLEEDEEETEASDSDVTSESEGEDGIFDDDDRYTEEEQSGYHDWGARMTKAAMVPPVTRTYTVIEEYRIVTDNEQVRQKMKVELPVDYEERIKAAKEKRSDGTYLHLDLPETKEYKPRKKLGEEVLEQEVYGIDPYTHNLLWDTMPTDIAGFSEMHKQQFIEEKLLLALNREARQYSASGKAPMELSLQTVVERISVAADIVKDWPLHEFSDQLLINIQNRPKEKFVAYRKGLGVVCNKYEGLEKDEFVVEFFGEVYPPWRWYEKQDGIRSLQKKDKDTTPEFYNIFYERPKGDATGYDLLVVDAMHKANFASRLCHSCRPNCEAKITAVNNMYIIGVYTLKPIKHGEELTFDYNSVTESKEEYNNAVCLCGSQGCRGSYLNLTGSGTFEEVLLKHHGLLDRHHLLLDSCSSTCAVSDVEREEMRQAGLGSCLLSGLPTWVLKYTARLVHFMNFEKMHLPAELLKDFELKRKQGIIDSCTEMDAEITTEGVYNQRLQNLAITLDKVRHILTKLYGQPSLAPPPLRKLNERDMVQYIWKGENSVVNELLAGLGPHLARDTFLELKQRISKHAPEEIASDLSDSLFWLRDELRRLPATCKARHDAAADLIHLYAYTRNFFITDDYGIVESTPVNIHPMDFGSSRHSLSGIRTWHKTYSREYVRGQLINWYKQNQCDPGASLSKAAQGCLTLPDISSCYAKSLQHDFRQGYGQKHREKMICHMVVKPQKKWPKSKIWSQFWSFRNERGLFGSPMLDSIIQGKPLDNQMVEWLKSRENVFVGPWDE